MQERTIDGRMFEIRPLNVEKGRKVFARSQKLLMLLAEEDKSLGIDPVAFSVMAGALSEEDLAFLCDQFAPTCTVHFSEDRVLGLSKCMDEVFAGQIDVMFEWLVACLDVNFGGYLAKMRCAVKEIAARAQQIKAATESSQ